MQHRVALLVIVGKSSFPDLARSFVNSRSVIESFLHWHTPPFIAKVYRPTQSKSVERGGMVSGRIELWHPVAT
jgi:hypothetical protein